MSFVTSSPSRYAFVPSFSSSIPGWPAPLEAWYVDIITRLTPNFLIKGHNAIRPIAVVQFGFAINLLFFVSSPFISGTTKGMSGSYRNADWKRETK